MLGGITWRIFGKNLWELPGAISGGIPEGTASEILGSEILSGIFEINPGGISVEISVKIPVVIS